MNPVQEVLNRAPIIAVVCGSGQVTAAAARADADLLFALNAGFYRSAIGLGSLASFMPFGNANDQTEMLLRQCVLPHLSKLKVPVIAGLLASDPTVELSVRLERLKVLGVQGLVNWPSLGQLDGQFRAEVEAEELSLAVEIDALAKARELGFFTFGYAGNPDDALKFVESGVDALVLALGLTRHLEDVYERKDLLQHNITQINRILEAVRKKRPKIKCLAIGGALSTPEDLEQFHLHTGIDGFIGGSAFDRFPVDSILESTVRRYKGAFTAQGVRKKQGGLGQIIGSSPKMAELFNLIKRVAPFDVNICIEGESGTGKELIATQIHRMSKRSQHAFVTLNCGAIPDSLLESELFGHEKGAFTGADRRRLGKFELANRGTLFLDEIADLSARGQVALLRVLQQGEVTRVGAENYIAVNVRILAASNRPLAKLVQEGVFRADLYHRLNHMCLIAPPLRERTEDIPLLVNDILSRLQVQLDRKLVGVTPGFQDKLTRHVWHGNVRELQHVLTRAALLEDAPVLEGTHFLPDLSSRGMKPLGRLGEVKKEACKEAVRQTLLDHRGNKSLAASALGVSRKTFYAWLRELDLEESAELAAQTGTGYPRMRAKKRV